MGWNCRAAQLCFPHLGASFVLLVCLLVLVEAGTQVRVGGRMLVQRKTRCARKQAQGTVPSPCAGCWLSALAWLKLSRR